MRERTNDVLKALKKFKQVQEDSETASSSSPSSSDSSYSAVVDSYRGLRRHGGRNHLQLHIRGKCLSKERLVDWISSEQSCQAYVREHLSEEKAKRNRRNVHEATLLARSLDFFVDELGLRRVCKLKGIEILVRRLFSIQVAMSDGVENVAKRWPVASMLEENNAGYAGRSRCEVHKALKVLNQENSLTRAAKSTTKGKGSAKGEKPS